MKIHCLIAITLSCFSKGIFARIQVPPEDLHVFHGESGLFSCTVDEGDQVTWSEVELGFPVQIYFGNVGTSNIQKTDDAKLLPKYDNFYIDSPEGSTFFNLNITEAQFNEDEGTYECNVFGGGAETAQLSVSVLPDSVDISCTPVDCSKLDGRVSQDDVICNCSANGVFPELLNIIWEGAAGTPTTKRNHTSTGLSGTFDLRSEASVQQTGGVASSISCSVGEYAKDPGSRGKSLTYISPMCSLEEPTIKVCTAATFTCKIENQPYPQDLYFQFFFQNGTEISRGLESEIVLNLDEGATVDLYCIACNGFMSHRSEVVTYTCPSGTLTVKPTTTDAKACDGTATIIPTTTDATKCDECTQASSPVLIAICCVEGVVVICMFVFLYTVKKGSRKEDSQSLATLHHDTTGQKNTAYMDLQETRQLSSSYVNIDVPFENINLQAPFPGKGLINYRKAQMTLTSERDEIVVKTVSDDAPVRLAKLQADEVRKLATLASNVNVAQFLGRCNNVPNLLCYEFVNGTKLGDYLRANFQPSKIHQYGNTKQKRFHVPEKGSVETLPRVALQIARGMKYLTALKFLHPGLRSEKVIIDVSGQCKLYDFVSNDNAKDIIAILWDKSVPYQWMPPEYLFLEKLGPLVDVWSFGVLMWEIFSYGALPYEGKGRSDVEKELRGKENLPLPNNCPGAIWQITLNCWAQSPEKRPSFDHLSLQLSHMCNDNKEYDEIQSK